MFPFNLQRPPRSEKTKAEYLYRYQKMRDQFMREAGQTTMDPDEVVAALVLKRDQFTSMSSFRKAKSAVLCVLEE